MWGWWFESVRRESLGREKKWGWRLLRVGMAGRQRKCEGLKVWKFEGWELGAGGEKLGAARHWEQEWRGGSGNVGWKFESVKILEGALGAAGLESGCERLKKTIKRCNHWRLVLTSSAYITFVLAQADAKLTDNIIVSSKSPLVNTKWTLNWPVILVLVVSDISWRWANVY